MEAAGVILEHDSEEQKTFDKVRVHHTCRGQRVAPAKVVQRQQAGHADVND